MSGRSKGIIANIEANLLYLYTLWLWNSCRISPYGY